MKNVFIDTAVDCEAVAVRQDEANGSGDGHTGGNLDFDIYHLQSGLAAFHK